MRNRTFALNSKQCSCARYIFIFVKNVREIYFNFESYSQSADFIENILIKGKVKYTSNISIKKYIYLQNISIISLDSDKATAK